jgi:hypothetical protein
MSDTPANNNREEALDEELTAYLDGELPPDSAKRVESLLAGDEKARDRLGDLAASWDLLDQLPRATVDDLFTRTTVEMVAVAAESEIAAATAPAKRRLQWIGGGIAAALAALVGFAAAALALPDNNEALLKDLPVVVDLELYRSAGDMSLLRQFQKEALFTEDGPVPAAIVSTNLERPAAIAPAPLPAVPDSLDARRAWVEALPAAEKADLRRSFEWYAAHPDEQKALRQFDKELHADPQSAELRKVMQRYHDWLKTLPPNERADLALKSPDARATEIKNKQLERTSRAISMYGGRGRPDQFGVAMRLAMDYSMSHEQEILSQLPEKDKTELQRLKADERDDSKGRRRPPLYQFALAMEVFRQNSPVKLKSMSKQDIESLLIKPEIESQLRQLPPDQAEKIKSLVDASDRKEELRKIVQAGIAGMQSRFAGGWGGRGFGGPTPAWMELTAEERKQIESLPEDQRDAKRREILLERRRSQDWQRGEGRGGKGGGDPNRGNRPGRGGPPPGEGEPKGKDGPPPPQASGAAT